MVLTESALVEAEYTCRFLSELSRYRRHWRLQLPHVLNSLMVCTLREVWYTQGSVVHSGKCGTLRGNVVHSGKCGTLRGNVVHSGKCGTLREVWYTQGSVVHSGEMWYTQGNVVHSGKCGTLREMWYTKEGNVVH